MKIAIVTRHMIIGGVERALMGMLGAMNSADEVDLYVEKTGGELFQELPNWVNVIEIPRKLKNVSGQKILYKVKSELSRVKLHFCKEYIKQCELSARSFPKIFKEYDLAIAYHAPNTIPMFYTVNNITAKKKVLWLHGDVETNHMTGKLANRYYRQYDKIFAVSRNSKEIFDKHFPELANRSEVFYNIIDTEYLYLRAEEGLTYKDDFSGMRILTIARLDSQKGVDMAIEACKMLLEQGMIVRWYVCGDGECRKNLGEKIFEYKIEDNFKLLGNQKNPYGYLRDCDIYVQPSRTEGYCTATTEARAFGKPVVTTDVCGMREQFVDGKTGLLCEINADAIYETVKKLLLQPGLQKELSANVKVSDNKDDINRLYQIVKNL